MTFRAWDGGTYDGEAPSSWYLGTDGLWWPPDRGPGPMAPAPDQPPPPQPPPPPTVEDVIPGGGHDPWQLDIDRPYPHDDPNIRDIRGMLGLPDGASIWPILDAVHWDLALQDEPDETIQYGLMPTSDRVVLERTFDGLVATLPLSDLTIAVAALRTISFLLLRDGSGYTITLSFHPTLAAPLAGLLVELGAAAGPIDLDPRRVEAVGSSAWPS